MRTLSATAFILFFCLFLLGACDIAGQPCGLANLDGCSAAGKPPTCGVVIPTPNTVVWECNLPAVAMGGPAGTMFPSDIKDAPCSLAFCEYVTQTEAGTEQEAAAWFTSQGFNLPAKGQTQITCKKTGFSTLTGAFSVAPVFSAAECVAEKEAPCAMFGEACAGDSHTQCCKPPESPFAMVCGYGTEDPSGTCCVEELDACQPGYPNGGCCPPNGDGPGDVCGNGFNSDAAHVNVCCMPTGSECYPATDSVPGEADDLCCSGLCYQIGSASWACSMP